MLNVKSEWISSESISVWINIPILLAASGSLATFLPDADPKQSFSIIRPKT